MGFRTHFPNICTRWHAGYFTLKESEKGQEREGLGPCPHPSPLKQVIRPSCERWPPCTPKEGAPSSPKMEGRERTERTGLAKLPQFPALSHSPSVLSCPHHFPVCIKPSTKHSGLTMPSRLISSWRLSCHVTLILNKCVCFALAHLSFS